MKKTRVIVSFLISIILIFVVACSSSNNNIKVDNPLPFSNSNYEHIVYSIQKTELKVNQNGSTTKLVIGTGELSFTLQIDNALRRTTIDMSFEITYNNDAEESDRGKTDSITSSATFTNISLSPISSQKSVKLALRDNKDDYSYSFDANYENGMSTYQDANGNKSLKINSGSGSTIDNEYLYYAIRSASNLKLGGSFNFDLSVLYDSFQKDSFETYSITTTVADDLTTIEVPNNIVNGITSEDGKSSLDALTSYVAISNTSNTGPSVVLNYSNAPFYIDSNDKTNIYVGDQQNDDSAMSKVLLQISTIEYDGTTQKYNTLYTIKSYSLVE